VKTPADGLFIRRWHKTAAYPFGNLGQYSLLPGVNTFRVEKIVRQAVWSDNGHFARLVLGRWVRVTTVFGVQLGQGWEANTVAEVASCVVGVYLCKVAEVDGELCHYLVLAHVQD
jgi:hypothetical protein